ncbi:hypothetical protein PIB30_026333 [Stylosanthes scabra]|uniref:Uncharacterized protein n=1 Tax=Stylosanthes scabra TaxID=79078 RepID=A0ABU6YC71_9FABA|nr:hypothetical protein [Stylosanthes scabra]
MVVGAGVLVGVLVEVLVGVGGDRGRTRGSLSICAPHHPLRRLQRPHLRRRYLPRRATSDSHDSTPGVRFSSTETGGSRQAQHTPASTSTQMPPPRSHPPRPPSHTPLGPSGTLTETEGDEDDEDEEASIAGDDRPLLRWDGHDCWLLMPEILTDSLTSTGKCTGSYQVIKV